MGEQALHCEMMVSFCICHSFADSMFCIHSDLTCAVVVAGVLYSVPPKRVYLATLFIGLWPHRFQKIMYLYGLHLSGIYCRCCDTTQQLLSHNISAN